MKRLRLVGLGIRLAVAGGRPAWIRIGLMSLGFTVGASLLLGAASILPALNAKDVLASTRAMASTQGIGRAERTCFDSGGRRRPTVPSRSG